MHMLTYSILKQTHTGGKPFVHYACRENMTDATIPVAVYTLICNMITFDLKMLRWI